MVGPYRVQVLTMVCFIKKVYVAPMQISMYTLLLGIRQVESGNRNRPSIRRRSLAVPWSRNGWSLMLAVLLYVHPMVVGVQSPKWNP